MKKTLLLAALAASQLAFGGRMLGRDAAARLYAPSNIVARVTALEGTALTEERLEPVTVSVSSNTTRMTARAFSTTTLQCTDALAEGETRTLDVYPEGSRNFDMFLPDDAVMRAQLPISLRVAVTGSVAYVSAPVVTSLPAYVHVREPKPGVVILTMEEVR